MKCSCFVYFHVSFIIIYKHYAPYPNQQSFMNTSLNTACVMIYLIQLLAGDRVGIAQNPHVDLADNKCHGLIHV